MFQSLANLASGVQVGTIGRYFPEDEWHILQPREM